MLSTDNQNQLIYPNENQKEISLYFHNYMRYANINIAHQKIMVWPKINLHHQHMLFKKTFVQLITWLCVFYHSTISSRGQISIHVILYHFGHFKYDSSSNGVFSSTRYPGKWT